MPRSCRTSLWPSLRSSFPPVSLVLNQPKDVAIGVGDCGRQPAATDVARGLLHGGTGSGHLGQLRLDIRHVPVGHGRRDALLPTARNQPDLLALGFEADV